MVYHASDVDFEAFDRNFIRNGSGFYFANNNGKPYGGVSGKAKA